MKGRRGRGNVSLVTTLFRLVRVLALAVFAFVLLGACSSCAKKDTPEERKGVNDVKKACEVRSAWSNRTAPQCISCISAAPSPPCDCEQFRDFGGLCATQGEARRLEKSCTAQVDTCTRACPDKDCACIDACYAQAPACKSASAARDGCVAEVCTRYCQ